MKETGLGVSLPSAVFSTKISFCKVEYLVSREGRGASKNWGVIQGVPGVPESSKNHPETISWKIQKDYNN